MFRFLILSLLCTSAFGGALPRDDFRFFMDFERDDRIVGGESAAITDAPWQVAMLRTSGSSLYLSCGGSIIKSNVILSAAHCISGTSPNVWRARSGSAQSLSGGQLTEISRTINHETYGSGVNRYDYDIGLYITSTPIDLSAPTAQAIALPNQDQSVADGTIGLISGWGATREGSGAVADLRKASIPVVNQQQCSDGYGGNWVTPRMICLGNFANGGLDACQGDSGGPFAIDKVIHGVTSWGNGCARPRYPGIWTRVTSFVNWINTNSP